MEETRNYDRGCTISLSGSDITWDLVDKRAKELGMIRSRYIQYAVRQEMKGKGRIKNREIVMFGIIILTFLALILNIAGVL